MKAKTKNTDLNGIDLKLAALLPSYTVSNWETRQNSRGTSVLYIRCRAILPPTKLAIAK